jgi:SEC-C motif-containing protein
MIILPVNLCPCGSHKKFKDCCLPYLKGEKVLDDETPEYVVRSRFSCAVVGDGAYMLKTWHKDFRPDLDAKDLGQQMLEHNFISLEIVSVELDESKTNARIEFYANFKVKRNAGYLHELGSFVKENGIWYYTDGIMLD